MSGAGGRRVLITGGSGFIGTNLVEHYLASGAAVRSLDVRAPRHPGHRGVWSPVDILDADALVEEFRRFEPSLVFHAAAQTDLRGKSVNEYRTNTEGVGRIIEAVRVSPGVDKVIFFSSRMVCNIGYQPRSEDDYCPPNAYGESKVAGELMVREAGLAAPWLIVRPTSIWGPWFGVPYRTFFDMIAHGRFCHTANSAAIHKSFGFIGNTIYQLDNLASAPVELMNGKTMYLADYPPLEIGIWAELVRRELDASPIRRLPYPILHAAALLGDIAARIGYEPPLSSFRLANLLTPMVYDLEPLRQIVGDLPYSLEAGVAQTVRWMREIRDGVDANAPASEVREL